MAPPIDLYLHVGEETPSAATQRLREALMETLESSLVSIGRATNERN